MRFFQKLWKPLLILACVLIVVPSISVEGQRRIIREVMGSGGQPVQSDQHRAHGTISQAAIGRLQRPNGNAHNVGFWYWARPFGSFACVRVAEAAAEPGTELTIPVYLEQADQLLRRGPLHFRMRIRYNGTLLEPRGNTPPCIWDGEDCILEIEGIATEENGVIASLEFTAKLGNDISTPLVIEEFTWLDIGEREIKTVRKHGRFTLLGVCRVGNEVRLIFAHGITARVSIVPNPVSDWANIEFVSDELGRVRIALVDGIGVERMLLVDEEVDAAKAYRLDVDFSQLSSGSYFLVMQTPSLTRTVPLIIQQ